MAIVSYPFSIRYEVASRAPSMSSVRTQSTSACRILSPIDTTGMFARRTEPSDRADVAKDAMAIPSTLRWSESWRNVSSCARSPSVLPTSVW